MTTIFQSFSRIHGEVRARQETGTLTKKFDCTALRGRMRLAIASVVFAVCACAINGQTCVKGTGSYGGTRCCGTTGCSGCTGYSVMVNSGNNYYKLQAAPCDCVYNNSSENCAAAVAAQKFLLGGPEQRAEKYQSRPMLFASCNGAILWVLPSKRYLEGVWKPSVIDVRFPIGPEKASHAPAM
jgi:hypothetical protein